MARKERKVVTVVFADLVGLGRTTDAARHVDRGLEQARGTPATLVGPLFVDVIIRLDRGAALAKLVEQLPDTPFRQAALLWLEGDPRGAADVYARMQRLPVGEGLARLAAARDLGAKDRFDEVDVEARRAIDLFRPMAARRYIEQAEAMLSTEARATGQPG